MGYTIARLPLHWSPQNRNPLYCNLNGKDLNILFCVWTKLFNYCILFLFLWYLGQNKTFKVGFRQWWRGTWAPCGMGTWTIKKPQNPNTLGLKFSKWQRTPYSINLEAIPLRTSFTDALLNTTLIPHVKSKNNFPALPALGNRFVSWPHDANYIWLHTHYLKTLWNARTSNTRYGKASFEIINDQLNVK